MIDLIKIMGWILFILLVSAFTLFILSFLAGGLAIVLMGA